MCICVTSISLVCLHGTPIWLSVNICIFLCMFLRDSVHTNTFSCVPNKIYIGRVGWGGGWQMQHWFLLGAKPLIRPGFGLSGRGYSLGPLPRWLRSCLRNAQATGRTEAPLSTPRLSVPLLPFNPLGIEAPRVCWGLAVSETFSGVILEPETSSCCSIHHILPDGLPTCLVAPQPRSGSI